jgi:hypothetical protein
MKPLVKLPVVIRLMEMTAKTSASACPAVAGEYSKPIHCAFSLVHFNAPSQRIIAPCQTIA